MLPQVLSMKKELNPVELDFLLRFPFKAGVLSPVDFLQHQGWGGIKVGVGTLSLSGGSLLTPGMFTTRYHRPDVQGPGEAPEVGLEGRGLPPARRKLYFPIFEHSRHPDRHTPHELSHDRPQGGYRAAPPPRPPPRPPPPDPGQVQVSRQFLRAGPPHSGALGASGQKA